MKFAMGSWDRKHSLNQQLRALQILSRSLLLLPLGLFSFSSAFAALPQSASVSEVGSPTEAISPSGISGALYVSGYAMAIRSTPSDNAGSPYYPETGFGFGASAGWRQDLLGLELGAQQVDRRFTVGADRISTEYLHLPLSLRVWLGDALSFGFGPTVAIGSGTVVVAAMDGKGKTRNLSFGEASLKPIDLGFTMSTQVQLLPKSKIGITLGAQYGFSLLNHASAGDFRYSDVQFMAGLRIGHL